ncbi:hypothetical protein KKA85_01460, partial [bacterium]|nr:hypothetical protein [bacterium]
ALAHLAAPGWHVTWRALPAEGVLPFAAMTLLTGALYVAALFTLKVVGRADVEMVRGVLPGGGDE